MASTRDGTVHEVAVAGFAEAERYERARPGYPPEAVAWLAEHLRLEPGSVAVDLAAGTGKLTRLLVPTGATVMAVEPVEEMRRLLARQCPTVPVAAGAAERLPLRAGSIEAVTVAQAFHWFDADAAEALGTRTGFGPLGQTTFHHTHAVTPDGVLDRFRSVSHVAVLPGRQQEAVLDEVREILAAHPETRGRAELGLPYRVDCLWCERL